MELSVCGSYGAKYFTYVALFSSNDNLVRPTPWLSGWSPGDGVLEK